MRPSASLWIKPPAIGFHYNSINFIFHSLIFNPIECHYIASLTVTKLYLTVYHQSIFQRPRHHPIHCHVIISSNSVVYPKHIHSINKSQNEFIPIHKPQYRSSR